MYVCEVFLEDNLPVTWSLHLPHDVLHVHKNELSILTAIDILWNVTCSAAVKSYVWLQESDWMDKTRHWRPCQDWQSREQVMPQHMCGYA